ncbi:hypothetical protein ES702_00506 [subsurface metagenome]
MLDFVDFYTFVNTLERFNMMVFTPYVRPLGYVHMMSHPVLFQPQAAIHCNSGKQTCIFVGWKDRSPL